MKKIILVILLLALLLPIAELSISTAPACASEWPPLECVGARWNPGLVIPCLVRICMEYGLDLEDYL